ncbi:MAG: CDP-glycerol glycerophosphotransferase family protein [Luteolibacter sp.]
MRYFREIAFWLYSVTPKRNFAVIWAWPDYEDSALALEKELVSTGIGKVIVLMTDVENRSSRSFSEKTKLVNKDSLSGWLWFCVSKYVFFTHRCFLKRFPKNVCSVNVWHGMPIKKIGYLLEGDEGISSRYLMATSPFWGGILKEAMDSTAEVLSFGLPRNDRLFVNRDDILTKLGIEGRMKFAAWLPTFRRSVRGHSRLDGNPADNPFEMPDADPDALNSFLRNSGAVMLVKPHPMAFTQEPRILSNLMIVNDKWLADRGVTLYNLLGATDVLVSDISSVVIDYLLLDRPVIHAFADAEEYEDSRGFTVEPIKDYFAGPLVKNMAQLQVALASVFSGDDPGREKRARLSELSHTYTDGKSSGRLIAKVLES